MYKVIKFAHDWNNKVKGEQRIFTTIRKYDAPKEKFYMSSVGDVFDVMLKEERIRKAKLISVNTVIYHDIHYSLLMVDTGYTDTDAIDKLFKNFGIGLHDTCLILVFEKVV